MIRVLYFFADAGTFMQQWQHTHIFDELSHHDVHIDVFNPLNYENYEQANELLLNTLKSDNKYDLFMNCCSYEQLYPATMAEIAKLPIPSLLICFDNLHAPFIHLPIAKYFTLTWLTSMENEEKFRKAGANTIFQPYAANPYAFKPQYGELKRNVCFIGTPYGSRTAKINKLLNFKIPTTVYYGKQHTSQPSATDTTLKTTLSDDVIKSFLQHLTFAEGRKMLLSRVLALFCREKLNVTSPFMLHLPSLSFNDMMEAYSNHCLSLNVVEVRNTYLLKHPLQKLHLRTFEIPMCGGLQFVSHNEELERYFENGKEIVTYHTDEEMYDKARYYLTKASDAEVHTMQAAARRRAENEHTWWNRFQPIMQQLQL